MGLPPPLIGDAQLLASELVTNSVRHSGLGPRDALSVTIIWSEERLRVTVRDRTSTAGLQMPAIRPRPGAEAGWGLYLVDQLADRWGLGPKGYWFELKVGGRRSA